MWQAFTVPNFLPKVPQLPLLILTIICMCAYNIVYSNGDLCNLRTIIRMQEFSSTLANSIVYHLLLSY